MDSSDDRIRPSLIFLVTCDAIGHGPDGKKTFYGVFDQILARQFPCIHPQMAIIVKWGLGMGAHEMKIRIATSDSNVIFETPQALKFQMNDPLVSVDLVINIQNLRIPKAGVYYVRILLDDEWIETERTLLVSQIGQQGGNGR